MNEWQRFHEPNIIIPVEPRISGSGADEVCKKLGKSHWIRSEANRFSGGIWLMWDEERIKIEPIEVQRCYIHASVKSTGDKRWYLTAVYASPRANERRDLWPKLDTPQSGERWLVIGDFNCVLKGEERNSGTGVLDSFVHWVGQRRLIDLGYTGQKYTWNHGGEAGSRRSARLDRGMRNEEWRCAFPMEIVRHLPHSYSDHCPLLFCLEPGLGRRLGDRSFKFQAIWLRHRDLIGLRING